MSMNGRFRMVTELELARFRRDRNLLIDRDPKTLDLRKEWHGVHMLMNGDPGGGEKPLDFIIDGGSAIGDDEWGYGAPRVFSPPQVRAIAVAMRALALPTTISTEHVYPWNGHRLDADDMRILLDAFAELKTYIANAAERGLALIVYLT